jgi:outer membrane protein assembly factor BamB
MNGMRIIKVFSAVACLAGAALAAAPMPGPDWPLFRGNALQTGVATATLPDQLEIRWRFEAKDSIEGTAAIAGDTVYVGSMDGRLYALRLDSGMEKWTYKSGPIKAPVSVRDGAVYVGDLYGVFHCVDAATGQKRWTFDTKADIVGGANFAGDSVLFGAGDETLYCLSLEGKSRWRFKVPGGPVQATPAVVGNRTFVAGCDSSLHVIDTATGKELAAVDLGGQTGSTAAVAGDRLYVGTMTNQFFAINWKKAEVVWRYEAARRPQPFHSSPAVTDKLVVVGSHDKRVHAIDRENGQAVWTFPTERKVDSSPVVVGKRVFVGSQDGNLYVLDLEKGTELRKLDLGAPISASPAVAGDCLVIGTEKGVLFCLGAKK